MASELRKQKRRSNRPAELEGMDLLPVEVTYYRSLRPLWDRNLKWKIQLPPLQMPSEDETRKESETASEPRKRKCRSNRPAELEGMDLLPVEVTYYRSLRPFWDRNLKWKVQLPPLQVSPSPQSKSQ